MFNYFQKIIKESLFYNPDKRAIVWDKRIRLFNSEYKTKECLGGRDHFLEVLRGLREKKQSQRIIFDDKGEHILFYNHQSAEVFLESRRNNFFFKVIRNLGNIENLIEGFSLVKKTDFVGFRIKVNAHKREIELISYDVTPGTISFDNINKILEAYSGNWTNFITVKNKKIVWKN